MGTSSLSLCCIVVAIIDIVTSLVFRRRGYHPRALKGGIEQNKIEQNNTGRRRAAAIT